ncbi:MAG: VWA domain-containing protein [Verrucomicrobiota bacterium]
MELTPTYNLLYLTWKTAPFWIGALIFVIAVVCVMRGRRGGSAAIEFSSPFLLQRLNNKTKSRAGGFAFPVILLLILVIGLIALMRPQFLRRYRMVKESGIEMIVALDVSRSMLVEDMMLAEEKVNRQTAAKSVIRDFIRRRPMDRIGLVAFAGRPYLASPITLDHSWLQQSLRRVQIGIVEDGTAIGSAIAAAARRLDKRESKSKVIVLLTDGANNAGNLQPETAAELANTLGIRIYTIAVGTPGRHTIPTVNGPLPLNQEFDQETLQAIADATNGKHFMAEDTSNLKNIFAFIDDLEVTEREARVRVEPLDWFPFLIFIAIALLVGRMIAMETLFKRAP